MCSNKFNLDQNNKETVSFQIVTISQDLGFTPCQVM